MTLTHLLSTIADLPADDRQQLLEAALGGLSLKEVLGLIQRLEASWEVDARPAAAPPPSEEPEPIDEPPPTFAVELTAAGEQKIAVIRALRELTGPLSIGEARALLARAPVVVLTGLERAAAEAAQAALEAAGASAALVAS